MTAPVVLCDPALLVPPVHEEAGPAFWERLIDWAGDRRLRVGAEARMLVVDHLAEQGWPSLDPPHCPAPLKRSAAQLLNTLLAASSPFSAEPVVALANDVPRVAPAYRGPDGGDIAIAIDAVHAHGRGLVGLATTEDSWLPERPHAITLEPPPPERVAVVYTANETVAGERQLRAAAALSRRRLTIVGGMKVQAVLDELEDVVGLTSSSVRWIECETYTQPNLDSLDGMQGARDVVCCVTGRIGHAGSDGVRKRTSNRGVELLQVEKPSEIAEALCERFGL